MFESGMRTFLAVIQTGSLSAAARALNIAQTSVSKRLAVLEEHMGMVLIERGKGRRALRLTPAGEAFSGLAERWSLLERETNILRAQGPSLSLVIAAVDSMNVFMLTDVYRQLHVDHPLVKIEVRTLHSDEMYSMVGNRQVDIAFSLLNQSYDGVRVAHFLSTPMVVLSVRPTGAGRARAGASGTIAPGALDPQKELYIRWNSAFEHWHDALWDPLAPSRIQLDSGHMLLRLLQDPAQWAIVPQWIADAATAQGDYLVRRFDDAPPDYVCYQLTHQTAMPSTQQSLDVLMPYLQALQSAK